MCPTSGLYLGQQYINHKGEMMANYRYSKRGYKKSYDNSTRQTYGQRYSPSKDRGTWYDAEGGKVRDRDAYFNTIERNGRYWEDE